MESATVECLPVEVLTQIFRYLSISDRKEASLVCRSWYEASLDPVLLKNVLINVDAASGSNARPLTGLQNRRAFHLALKNIDGCANSDTALASCQAHLGKNLISLSLKGSNVQERSFLAILKKCTKLVSLDISCCNSLLLSGSSLALRISLLKLPNLKDLNLSSLHHLSDATLGAFLDMASHLNVLYLASVPMIFRAGYINAINNGSPSTAVLTFHHFIHKISSLTGTLTGLDLSRTGISDDALLTLATVPKLQLTELSLVQVKDITSKGIMTLCSHQSSLVHLNISLNSQLSDSAIVHIGKHLLNLVRLNISKLILRDAGINALQDFGSVEELRISGCLAHDLRKTEADSTFPKLSRIKLLDLSYCNSLSDSTLISLCRYMGNITHLDLNSSFHITDVTVREISMRLRALTYLSLAWCNRISDCGILGFVDEAVLPHEHNDGCKCDRQKDVAYFVHNPPVRDIAPMAILPNYDQVMAIIGSEKGAIYPLNLLTSIKVLDLSCCPKLTDLSICIALRFVALESLCLDMCKALTDKSIETIAANNRLLCKLSISNCIEVTDRGIQAVLTFGKRLTELNVSGCSKLTDASLDAVITSRCKLKVINLALCNVTLPAIERLGCMVPSLTTIHKLYTGTH